MAIVKACSRVRVSNGSESSSLLSTSDPALWYFFCSLWLHALSMSLWMRSLRACSSKERRSCSWVSVGPLDPTNCGCDEGLTTGLINGGGVMGGVSITELCLRLLKGICTGMDGLPHLLDILSCCDILCFIYG